MATRKKPTEKKNHFDYLLKEIFEWGRNTAEIRRVGIEIEVEAPPGIVPPVFEDIYWTAVPDGSLRNGVEYVLRQPISMAMLDEALTYMRRATQEFRYRLSDRCSTHIHMNVQSYNLREITQVCAAWWMFENVFVRTQGSQREGNLFALRAKDAEHAILSFADQVSNQFNASGSPWIENDENLRYASFNLSALRKFGSLEFRFLRAILLPNLLDFWVRTLDAFVENARGISVDELVKAGTGSALDKSRMLARLIGQERTEQLLAMFRDATENGETWSDVVDQNIHYPLLIQSSYASALEKMAKPVVDRDRQKRYAFPVNEDIDVEEQYGITEEAVVFAPFQEDPVVREANAEEELAERVRGIAGRFNNLQGWLPDADLHVEDDVGPPPVVRRIDPQQWQQIMNAARPRPAPEEPPRFRARRPRMVNPFR